MFNNFTCEREYESYNIILEKTQGRGALLLGDFNSATDETVLRENNVKTVITAATGLDHLEIPTFVTHIVYALLDAKSENIFKYFEESFNCIEKSINTLTLELREGSVLVHCAAGVSRVRPYLLSRQPL